MTSSAEEVDAVRLRDAAAGESSVDGDLVSVVVPALNEQAFLGACLTSVLRQTHRNVEVLVVDNGSTDSTVELVERAGARDGRIRLLHNPSGTIPRSLNIAVAQARGRWLVRVDAHSTIPPDYVATAVHRLSEGLWGGVGGRKDGYGETPTGRAIAVALGSRFGVGNSHYHHARVERVVDHVPFGAYPMQVVRSLGGWDEELIANEDYEFDYRVRQSGRRLLLDPQLSIRWRSRESIPDLYRQYRRYGRGKVDVLMRHPASISPRHTLPPVLVAYGAAIVLMGLRRPRVAGAMICPYAAGLLAASAGVAPRLDTFDERARLPMVFGAMHLGWGIGFWHGLLAHLTGRRCLASSSPAGPASPAP